MRSASAHRMRINRDKNRVIPIPSLVEWTAMSGLPGGTPPDSAATQLPLGTGRPLSAGGANFGRCRDGYPLASSARTTAAGRTDEISEQEEDRKSTRLNS